jgi:hypothetical protein
METCSAQFYIGRGTTSGIKPDATYPVGLAAQASGPLILYPAKKEKKAVSIVQYELFVIFNTFMASQKKPSTKMEKNQIGE